MLYRIYEDDREDKFDPKKDEVIIAGDIIDRGSENLEMFRYMESKPKSVMFHIDSFVLLNVCFEIGKVILQAAISCLNMLEIGRLDWN